jgi:hypothetical protein
MFFFWLTLPALALLLREAKFSPAGICLALIPFILAPIYLVYSRTVLIEPMALSGAAWFLVGVLHYRRNPHASMLLLTLVAGTVAVLVKPTTWSVFCIPWAILFVRDAWQAGKLKRWPSGLAEQATLIGVPLLVIAFGWVWIADQIKALNPNAGFLLSSSLREFNYGTLEQRFSAESWRIMLEHSRTNIGPGWVILLGLGAMFCLRSSRLWGMLAVAAFLTGPLIFFNLYLLHDYYFYANAVGVVLAIGAGLAALWDHSRNWDWAKPTALLLLALVVWGELQSHKSKLLPQQLSITNGESKEVLLIKTLTSPDEVVVFHATGWSSGPAYYSGRRLLTIPDFQMSLRREQVFNAVAQLADENVALLILSGDILNRSEWISERIHQLGFMSKPFAIAEGFGQAHTSRKNHDRYQEILQQHSLKGWRVTEHRTHFPQAPIENRVPIAESMWPPEIRPIIGPNPEFGVIPFGLNALTHDGQTFMMVHGGSELYFKTPADSSQFICSFIINPKSFDQHDWDGLEITLEGYDSQNRAHLLKTHLIEADHARTSRTMGVRFDPTEFNYIRLRVLPGPRGSQAFDHAWFSRIEFQ